MTQVVPPPVDTRVLIDDRGAGRALRVSWHPEAGDSGLVVLSLWQAGHCVGTFRLRREDVPELVTTLTAALV